jgi:alanyl-tRNA synthetase
MVRARSRRNFVPFKAFSRGAAIWHFAIGLLRIEYAMMTSTQIRRSFLDFFKSKQHTLVPSSSLMPDSPNLLFTNAGMNQFVPIFLGQSPCPFAPGRAADTQKCIRAGGKHNDLDDVGLDTYHHTFFEMLGNWSFGDYFKKEAIEWAWELVINVWKFPPQRLYATVYHPDKAKNDPSEFDQEAWNHWAAKFRSVGLDPAVHIVNGNKKDNFWMMGDTGPCGPCSELHVDLTPAGDTKGALVNKGDARCIEIWNLVFIQFNANPDGTFSPLPARHVDTGMGFERAASIIQGTKGLTDFANAKISNYETDIFRPIFDAIEKLSGRKYGSTLPKSGSTGDTEQEKIDVAFRVIADHIRTLSFAIADGIQPGNTDRNYVLRRILRRAVRYGRALGFQEPFFFKLVEVLADTMGDVFPEIRAKKKHVQEVIRAEEEAFNKTLDRGIEVFQSATFSAPAEDDRNVGTATNVGTLGQLEFVPAIEGRRLTGQFAFKLYDTYGFPLDLTELMARERGLTVDVAGFNKLMEEQRERARKAQKKTVIELAQFDTNAPTKFLGFDYLETEAVVEAVLPGKKPNEFNVVFDRTACYAEMGGQVGDAGLIHVPGHDRSEVGRLQVVDTVKQGAVHIHRAVLTEGRAPEAGEAVRVAVDLNRRNAIQRHHTVTHLLHWALHEVVSREASQKGSFVGPDKLTFDFNSAALSPAQVADIEKLVNERILENGGVSWTEVPYAEVKSRKDVMQFFGDKYGDTVRVVQIGGQARKLDGYSMELCGGTHTRATGEIGLFRIVAESAIAAGVRRIEAVAGLTAYQLAKQQLQLIKSLAGKVNSPVHELEKKIEALLAHQKELEQEVKLALLRNASNAASELLERIHPVNGIPFISHNLGDANGEFLQAIADELKGRFKGVVVLGGCGGGAVALVATVSPEHVAQVQAGKLIQTIAPIVGGKGGGKPDNARGGGKDATKIDEALAKAKSLLG